jgi:hypothetical protein
VYSDILVLHYSLPNKIIVYIDVLYAIVEDGVFGQTLCYIVVDSKGDDGEM